MRCWHLLIRQRTHLSSLDGFAPESFLSPYQVSSLLAAESMGFALQNYHSRWNVRLCPMERASINISLRCGNGSYPVTPTNGKPANPPMLKARPSSNACTSLIITSYFENSKPARMDDLSIKIQVSLFQVTTWSSRSRLISSEQHDVAKRILDASKPSL